ncbi:MAG TPA: hypothetical protein VJ696_03040 [Rhodanobacteraceae bacterium]|nr:hypothetical protein [Rhodanobacteraceae bacterium]
MPGDLAGILQQLAPTVASLLVLAALVVLWRAHRSVWLAVAIAAELASIFFRGALVVYPDTRALPMFFTVWTLTALAFAVALLGYAIETTSRRQ